MSEWVKVSERLPENYIDVLLYNEKYPNEGLYIGSYYGTAGLHWVVSENGVKVRGESYEIHTPKELDRFTHWQPLPLPPGINRW